MPEASKVLQAAGVAASKACVREDANIKPPSGMGGIAQLMYAFALYVGRIITHPHNVNKKVITR
jgi:hypothetical protein